jgi:pyrimidine-nucleoside phosphorylase
MDLQAAIGRRRDGGPSTAEDFQNLAHGAADGSTPDYQLSAWLMAAFLNPLTPSETAELTLAMADSGERLDLSGLPKPWVDKHSTGGVGDKTSLVVLPMLAACGLTVVKMSGRGLGITGGTIDKLSSVPGFRTDLSPEELKAQAKSIGIALTGQTPRLAPADKALYALRDATGTVESIPLIASSILSKKIAGGAEVIVLDVKCGSGAFMRDLESARALKQMLEDIGGHAGLTVRAFISDMDQPLGRCAGNALEVKEAIRVLKGETGRFRELCVHCVRTVLEACGLPDRAVEVLEGGSALAKAKEWFAAQGGDLTVFESEDWGRAAVVREVRAAQAGWVERVDARRIGELVVNLGGGRKRKEDAIDPAVGCEVLVEVGDQVRAGDAVLRVHSASVFEDGEDCVIFSAEPVVRRDVILES